MRSLFFTLIVCVAFQPTAAFGECSLQHATSFGDASFDVGYDLTIDPDGRLILSGSFFSGTIQFEGLAPLVSAGSEDVLLAVFAADGTPIWAKSFGGSNTQLGVAVDHDASGNIVLAGLVLGTIDFGGGPLYSAGYGIFLVKLDGAGNHLWSQVLNPSSHNFPTSVAVAPNGDVVLLAEVSTFAGRIYLARFDSEGDLLRAEVYASTDFDDRQYDYPGNAAVTSTGDVLFTGSLGGVAQFGAHTTTFAGETDAFVAKVDPAGTVQWVSTWGGSQAEHARALTVAANGTAYFAGEFQSPDAPGLTGGPYVLQDDWFIACANSSGVIEWIRNGGTTGRDRIEGIALTSLGDIVVTGSLYGDFNHERLLLASCEADGTPRFELVFADGMGGIDRGYDVVLNANDEMIMTGSFGGILDLCSEILTSAGDGDGFLIRMREPGPVPAPPANARVKLEQNHPNPFNPLTTIRCRLDEAGPLSIDVFDVAGRRVRRLATGPLPAGEHSVRWDGRDETGKALASGIYHYRLVRGTASETRSMVLVR